MNKVNAIWYLRTTPFALEVLGFVLMLILNLPVILVSHVVEIELVRKQY